MGVDTAEHRSVDTTNMLNYAFANYKLNTIVKKDDIVSEISIKKGKINKSTISPKEDVTDILKQNEKKDYSYNINKNVIEAPINKGDVVGSLEIVDNKGKVIKIIDLVINDTIEKHNFFSLFYSTLKNIINGF